MKGAPIFIAVTLIALLSLAPAVLPAPQSESKSPALTPTQATGRRIFQQRCGVCHTQVTPTNPMYGLTLYKDLVDGNEDVIRDYIRNGSKRMPGFKYGLEPSDIDAIVEYLKTVPKPAPRNSPSKGEGAVD
jgi:mono/diheme cytochrome c family protein